MNHEPIHLQNSLTREREVFTPLSAGAVTIYACGPTVYDDIHIGNLRAYLLPDLLQRLFRHHGYDVTLTINFTDFGHLSDDGDAGEDKIMKGMVREGYDITLKNMLKFVVPYIESFKSDNAAFGNLPATTYARASEYVPEQIKLIKTLVEKGHAYETSDGVYFDVSTFPTYGKLCNIDLDQLQAGARVDINPEKKHPADFALWKKADLGWESDWGTGFPGWHIECAAMAFATLGEQIDIHTGGEDLAYTHHNGEIAEAEAATGKQFTRYWLHNAHITIADKKIAKSTGNGVRVADLEARGFSALDYRYWLLQSHYRTTSDFSWEALEAAKTARHRLLRVMHEQLADVTPDGVDPEVFRTFLSTLHNDLDTPKALAIIWETTKNTDLDPTIKKATLLLMNELLELGLSKPPAADTLTVPAPVQKLVDAREAARSHKDWAEADRLRAEIATHGFEVKDSTTGAQLVEIKKSQ